MDEAIKSFVSVAVGDGPDEPAEQVEVVVHDKPRFLREKPKLVHRITKEDLWGAKERLRKISIDTLDSVFAGFEMPQATSQCVCFWIQVDQFQLQSDPCSQPINLPQVQYTLTERTGCQA